MLPSGAIGKEGFPRHLPQIALRVREEPVASEKGLLCFLDHPGPGLCGLREYRVDVLLPSHVVRQREAREGAVLHVGYIETRVLGERGFREEGSPPPAALEERHLVAARALPGPSQAVAVGGYRATEVAHAERNDTHPWLHRSLPCGGCALGYCLAGNRRSHREICPYSPGLRGATGPAAADQVQKTLGHANDARRPIFGVGSRG